MSQCLDKNSALILYIVHIVKISYNLYYMNNVKGMVMPKVSSKRQITIPIDLCEEAHIKPGDEIEAFIYKGQITIVKKDKFAAKGILAHIKPNKNMTDEYSLHETLSSRH